MKTLVAFPSTAIFGQQAARAFEERDALAGYMTSFVYREDGALAAVLRAAPEGLRSRVAPQLRRRVVSAVGPDSIESHAFWEVVRTMADKLGASAPVVDRIWDHLSRDFTRKAAHRLARGGVDVLYAYEYTALEAFRAARARGVATVLDFPSLNSRQFEAIQREEKSRFPELRGRHDLYFEGLFEARQARRDDEMRTADLIVTNSSVTRRSHIAGGADPARTIAVPYGAPPTVAEAPLRDVTRPFRAIWAGTFSIRKGAHYFVEAWRKLAAGGDAQADVFGAVTLPDRLWKPAPPGMTFHGSVVRSTLFEAFDAADVLVFPTLSDGFGMVVTEAFARGLPVITTDQAGASDFVVHEKNGLIIPAGDPGALEAALRWCLDNRARLADMAPAALESARGWQWSDYRAALYAAVTSHLQGATPAARAR